MREIKFRAWIGDKLIPDIKIGAVGWMRKIPNTIGIYDLTFEQFTGLQDKNGVDIYEGDIVYFNGTKRDEAKGKVEYKNGSFQFSLIGHIGLYKHITGWANTEVIGNIHTNKDLI